jgi:hypothetical protein
MTAFETGSDHVPLKFLFPLLAMPLIAFTALPAAADDAAMRAAAQLSVRPLPDESDGPLQLLSLVGPAAVIVVLTILGLTITISNLREDMRKRHAVYRHRGHDVYAGGSFKR